MLAFGMLAMAGFQTRLVAQTSEAQARNQAPCGLADELLSPALVDPANLACYRRAGRRQLRQRRRRGHETAQWGERATDRNCPARC
jgi:Tfp pilus assembly protein PilV